MDQIEAATANKRESSTEVDVEVDMDVDLDSVSTKRPHFLDYDDAVPSSNDLVDQFDRIMDFTDLPTSSSFSNRTRNDESDVNNVNKSSINTSDQCSVFPREKRIMNHLGVYKDSNSDLSNSNESHRMPHQDYRQLEEQKSTMISKTTTSAHSVMTRKHFVNESCVLRELSKPINSSTRTHELREHRSLDRNFERNTERNNSEQIPFYKDVNFANGKDTVSGVASCLTKGSTWTQSFDGTFADHKHLQMTFATSSALNERDCFDKLGSKVECVYSLLSMLGSNDPLEMAKKFYELSRSTETCVTLRRSGCIPLLVQMIHAEGGAPDDVRKWAGMALHNVIHSHPDEKSGRREIKVLRLLDHIIDYYTFLRTLLQSGGEAIADDADRHPLASMSSLMKVSFDEEHRHAMCELGALHAIPNLVQLDHAVHGPRPENQCCNSLRRFALMALTNLTFGDENNKALLCSQKSFMEALVAQLESAPDDLLQVTASVLRNLSWRADSQMKSVLNEIGTVTALTNAAMKNKCENTLKAILSALWNLSAHCSTNKAEFCSVDGSLSFIVRMLTYEGPSKTLKIIESAGGILRNVSSHIVAREDYRRILREHNCLSILLQQLKSESLTVVSNSCGTLWNLSARCPEDQQFLWDNGAVPMLRSLIHSKHTMISEGSACALKNLLNYRPPCNQSFSPSDTIGRSLHLKKLPSLNVRKQKALERELGVPTKTHLEINDRMNSNQNSNNTNNDNLMKEEKPSPSTPDYNLIFNGNFNINNSDSKIESNSKLNDTGRGRSEKLCKSQSRDSIFSIKSDSSIYNNPSGRYVRSHSAHSGDISVCNKSSKSSLTSKTQHFSTLRPDVVSDAIDEQPIDYAAKYTENIAMKSNGNDDDVAATVVNCPNETENENNGTLLILEDTVKCYQTEDTPYIISNAGSSSDLRIIPEGNEKQNKTLEDCNPESRVMDSATNNLCTNPSSVKNINLCSKRTSNVASYSKTRSSRLQQSSNIGNGREVTTSSTSNYRLGSYTPEKPVNYCEEGTPGYFSRYESLSSLDECTSGNGKATSSEIQLPENSNVTNDTVKQNETILDPQNNNHFLTDDKIENIDLSTEHCVDNGKTMINKVQSNSALETPLMFSRGSSVESLSDVDIGPIDDKSSIVSDFSRLASGVISPSEIPDSPTQSMPHSPPPCNSNADFTTILPIVQKIPLANDSEQSKTKGNLKSVFEDNLSTFNVENTPAQFSTATSLSNLSILEEDLMHSQTQNIALAANTNRIMASAANSVISEGDEEEEEEENEEDDLLLANCINIGMNRLSNHNNLTSNIVENNAVNSNRDHDEPKQYCTEDTPALLSKMGSNTNLSAISICSKNMEEEQQNYSHNYEDKEVAAVTVVSPKNSLNLSKDLSLNSSGSDGADSGDDGNSDILQQCIREGMQKTSLKELPYASTRKQNNVAVNNSNVERLTTERENCIDPIAMLRRGGNYISNTDEINRYQIEDSPCNFSVRSDLSNLTVESNRIEPTNNFNNSKKTNNNKPEMMKTCDTFKQKDNIKQDNNRPSTHIMDCTPNHYLPRSEYQDDSLSSLSIESEDDTDLLNQVIAAGRNRPRSNSSDTRRNIIVPNIIRNNTAHQIESNINQKSNEEEEKCCALLMDGDNESLSSIESTDSNDNQSKSLLEMCILRGMHKNNKDNTATNERSENKIFPNDFSTNQRSLTPPPKITNITDLDHTKLVAKNRHLIEQEQEDQRILMECINTGIMKKIGGSPRQTSLMREALMSMSCSQSKNLLDTSVVTVPALPTPVKDVPIQRNDVQNDVKQIDIINKVASDVEITINQGNRERLERNNLNLMKYRPKNPLLSKNFNVNNNDIIPNIKNENPHGNIREDLQQNQYKILQKSQQKSLEEQDNQHSVESVQATLMEISGFKLKHSLDHNKNINNNLFNSLSTDECRTNSSDDSNQSIKSDSNLMLSFNEKCKELDTKVGWLSGSYSGFDSLSSNSFTTDKHKNPDLMLRSVERLTREFVSSAEQQLRNSANVNSNDIENIRNKDLSNGGMTVASSNNTWNENTCPNDVSFPSISITIPKISSLSSDYDGDENNIESNIIDGKEYDCIKQDLIQNENSLNDFKTKQLTKKFSTRLINESIDDLENNNSRDLDSNLDANSCNRLNFQLGGVVQTAAATINGNNALLLNGDDNSMINSSFMAEEAHQLAVNLQNCAKNNENYNYDNYRNHDLNNYEEVMKSSMNSLTLDNICPPSGMESLNISGYYHDTSSSLSMLQNPMSLASTTTTTTQRKQQPFSSIILNSPKILRKVIPSNVMARRAIMGHLNGGVVDHTINCNTMEENLNSNNFILDNIKPPLLMDELLDSMISVASIVSEVADDCPPPLTLVETATTNISNYETAGTNEQNFMQQYNRNENFKGYLRKNDSMEEDDVTTNANTSDSNLTPLPSDCEYASASDGASYKSSLTAINSKRYHLTPKQKRKLAKDRYKTYTISAENLKYSTAIEMNNVLTDATSISLDFSDDQNCTDNSGHFREDDSNHIHKKPLNLVRRRSTEDRYKTQTIETHIHPQKINDKDYGLLQTHPCPSNLKMLDETEMNLNVVKEDLIENAMLSTKNLIENNTSESKQDKPLANKQISLNKKTEKISMVKNIVNNKGGSSLRIPIASNLKNFTQRADTLLEATSIKKLTGGITNKIPTRKKELAFSNYGLIRKNKNKNSLSLTTTPTLPPSSQSQSKGLVYSSNELRRQNTFIKDQPSIDAAAIPIVEEATSATQQSSKFKEKISKNSNGGGVYNNIYTRFSSTRMSSHLLNKTSVSSKSGIGQTSTTCSRISGISPPQRANSNVSIHMKLSSVTTNLSTYRRTATTNPPSRSNSSLNGFTTPNGTAKKGTSMTVLAANRSGIIANINSPGTRTNQAQSRIASIWRSTEDKNKNPTIFLKTNEKVGKSPTSIVTNVSTNGQNSKKLPRSTTFNYTLKSTSKGNGSIQNTSNSSARINTGHKGAVSKVK